MINCRSRCGVCNLHRGTKSIARILTKAQYLPTLYFTFTILLHDKRAMSL